MASRAHVVIDTPHLILVQVDHRPADSFSRSVIPTATRQWKRAVNRSTSTRFTAYAFAVDGLGTGGLTTADTCVSFAAFAPSFDLARDALDRHTESLRATA